MIKTKPSKKIPETDMIFENVTSGARIKIVQEKLRKFLISIGIKIRNGGT